MMSGTALETIQSNINRIHQKISTIQSFIGTQEGAFAQVLEKVGVPKDFSKDLQAAFSNIDPSGKTKAQIKAMVVESAQKYGVDPSLAMALVQMESGFNPNAVSKVGAMGLMQLMPGTAAGLGVDEPLNPAENIDGGMRYLKSMLTRYQKPELALAAYNAGPGAVAKYKGVPPYRETQNYVKTIQALQQKYAQEL
ncbi:MAG: lytic transglycosylase domain-containing protein [Vampirovibrionales bacterium]|nr:lytic transglycosylase domain-containing protein [Vampirovibrionales bacterium]